jgi:hypothetical protein
MLIPVNGPFNKDLDHPSSRSLANDIIVVSARQTPTASSTFCHHHYLSTIQDQIKGKT